MGGGRGGRFNKRRGGRGGGGGGRDGAFARDFKRQKYEDRGASDHGGFTEVQRTNEQFEAYYKAQKIVPEAEWEYVFGESANAAADDVSHQRKR